jgi:hypothetical protein
MLTDFFRSTSFLTTGDQLEFVMRGWVALDQESGAYLIGSRGRSSRGNAPRYWLILPEKTVVERDGYFADRDAFVEWKRTSFRAWTPEEAISIANTKLPKMLADRAKRQAAQKEETAP